MRYNRLGQTGLFVSELCLGTMTFGQAQGRYAAASGVDAGEVDKILRSAVDAGVNFIDTANVYANGQAEEIVGQAIRSSGIGRDELVVATKFEHATGSGPNDAGGSRSHVLRAAKDSLKRLGTDHIDLYWMHGFDPATPIAETIGALDDLVRQGLVRYVGISNVAAWQVSKALGVSALRQLATFAAYQGYYSLVGRDVEREIIPMVEAEGLGFVGYSPLAGGFLTGKYRDGAEGRRKTIQFPPVDEQSGAKVLEAMDPIAAAHGASLEAVALAWLRQQSAVTSAIIGVKSVEQLNDNLKAADLQLSDDELATLGKAGAPSPQYPGWMLAQSSAPRAELLATGRLPEAH